MGLLASTDAIFWARRDKQPCHLVSSVIGSDKPSDSHLCLLANTSHALAFQLDMLDDHRGIQEFVDERSRRETEVAPENMLRGLRALRPAMRSTCSSLTAARASSWSTTTASTVARRRLLCSSTGTAPSPPKAEGSAFVAWCAANPMKLGIGVATVKTQAADLLTQKSLEGKAWSEIDWRRNGLFTVFGFAYQGCFQYYLYVTLFSRWFAGAARFANQPFAKKLTDRAGQIDVLKQTLFDILIHPIWFFPMYYTLKEMLCGKPNLFDGASPGALATTALGRYWRNNFDVSNPDGRLSDWIAFWKIWVVGDVVVYGLCPMWARLPMNHVFSFVYICVLSFMRGASEPDEKK